MKYLSKGQGQEIFRFPATTSPPGDGKNKMTKNFHFNTQAISSVCCLKGFYVFKRKVSLA